MSGWLVVMLAQAAPLVGAAVPDATLAEQRGGFQLPSGIDVALTVQTQTAIDGAVVLRTVFTVDQAKPTLTIFAPATGQIVAAGTAADTATGQTAAAPSISFDRNGGLQVIPGMVNPSFSVSTNAASTLPEAPGSLSAIASGTTTDSGFVTEAAANGLRTVSLEGADFVISHITGNAFGSSIVNSGSDRTIDTQTVVSIDLRGAGPDVLGSAMFRVEDITQQAMSIRPNG